MIKTTINMKRIFLKLVYHVAVLASVTFWSAKTESGRTPCDGVTCPSVRRCAVDETGQASCVCDINCNEYYNPVCGSDNRTYSNQCELTREMCRTNTNLKVKYRGHCRYEGRTPCDGVTCPSVRRCAVDETGQASCVCDINCNEYYNPVCGSDNITYSNQCELTREMCRTNTNLTVTYTGHCRHEGSICAGVICPSDRECAISEQGATCVCNQTCPTVEYPVCGSNNRTYINDCDLQRRSCLTNANITVAYRGECKQKEMCNGVTCPIGRECAVGENRRPVCVRLEHCPSTVDIICATNGRTYANECHLRKETSPSDKGIQVANNKSTRVKNNRSTRVTNNISIRVANNRSIRVANNRGIRVPYNRGIRIPYNRGIRIANNRSIQTPYNRGIRVADNRGIRVAYKGFCLEGSVCYDHRCPLGKQCAVDPNNQPVCVCFPCSYGEDYNYVCGSDGITYRNSCQLKREACTKGTNLTAARTGPCKYRDHCLGVVCSGRQFCIVDKEYRTSCVCPDEPYVSCDGYYEPICGSDNQTYDSYCHMSTAECKTNTSITHRSIGFCSKGPNCQGIYCGDGKHCDSEHQPEPKCVCNNGCPKTYDPICGSNNKTYDNSCELQQDACLTNSSISVRFKRRCDEGPGCSDINCPNGRTCVVDERNRPICVCSQYCHAGSKEDVCGSDNKTYSSECFLTVAACMTNKSITVQSYGQCRGDPCKGVVCSSDKKCVVNGDGRTICVCNDKYCLSLGSPVCGSDNRTYSNYCELRKRSCLSGSSVQRLYYGRCVEASICDGVTCPPDKRCAVDERYQPTCVCIEQCLRVGYPVCGSDGHTYLNECELQKEACMRNTSVTIAYRGKCDQGLTCKDISCKFGRICALNERNQPTCVCEDTDCSTYNQPVCGSDGKTYNNMCYLVREACMTDSNVELKDYYGPC